MRSQVFSKLGFPEFPVFLAPLAGVTDHPFRRTCAAQGAALTYVEMLSAKAVLYESKRTFEMMVRHEEESILGVQVTGGTADDVAQAIEVLDRHPYDTIDINMGCPVPKVVKSGSGSAILKDPDRVYETVKKSRAATSKPLSVKIRLGWDKSTVTVFEVADAAEKAGADWITVHGRLRSQDYSDPVDLAMIRAVKQRVNIPVLGNGNIFCAADAVRMRERTGVDGVMVSRGAMGNPWIFREILTGDPAVGIDEWLETVERHLAWQGQTYGNSGMGAVCMRKHLLWYAKGWPGAKKLREQINAADSIAACLEMVREFHGEMIASGMTNRLPVATAAQETGQGDSDTVATSGQRFLWDPKYDMDRKLDRGVGDDLMNPVN